MSEEYTPTTSDVKWDYQALALDKAGSPYEESGREFDRWLAEEKAKAWDEGFDLATRNNPNKPHPMRSCNPYRRGGSDE